MDTNDLQDRASKLLRALEDGDANKARDMLHGEDALDVALALSVYWTLADRTTLRTARDVLAILAAERMARETLARTLGNPSGALASTGVGPGAVYVTHGEVRVSCGERDTAFAEALRAELAHGRAVADLYATDEDVEARR